VQTTDEFSRALALVEKIHATGFGPFRPPKDKPQDGALRPQQLKAVRQILHALLQEKKKYIVLTAPTGSGKSVIAAVLSKVLKEVMGYKTNLTTSSRALQKQYGVDLSQDDDFKVVMGTANYACSLYRDESNLHRTGKSPCQDTKRSFREIMSYLEPADSSNPDDTGETGIQTIHRDQDEDVFDAIPEAIAEARRLISELDAQEEESGKSQDREATFIKKACRGKGGCSYYRARDEAEESPVAIRSMQHLLFYIMFGVKIDGMPVLQQREVHIHDECHNLENTFRDFFSATFSDKHYSEMLGDLDAKFRKGRPREPSLEITADFRNFKSGPGEWSSDDRLRTVETVHKELGQAVERFILPDENWARTLAGDASKPRLNSAEEFLRASVQGDLRIDLDSLRDGHKTVLGWFKNTYHALKDVEREKQKKGEGFSHKRRYAINLGKDKGTSRLAVSPLSLEGMVDRYFGEKQTVFMSATPQPARIFEQMFGIEGQAAYIEIESDFPPERSPIFHDPVDTITNERARTLGAEMVRNRHFKSDWERQQAAAEAGWIQIHASLAGKIREILLYHPDLPGIIPCSSYKMVQALQTDLSDLDRMIFAVDGESNRKAVIEFKRRAETEPVVLVSAGISEGHSFNDKVSRLQIIPKMPYAVRDPEMEELCKRWGPAYYANRTATTLQQMVGRSMRSKGDYCKTILLDQKHSDLKSVKILKNYSRHFAHCLRWDEDWRHFRFPSNV
jgi:Rad3-related DNA helicase